MVGTSWVRLTGTLVLVLCASALVAPGCGDASDSQRRRAALSEGCSINSDCASPLVCVFRRCHNECEDQRDCDLKELCVTSDRPYRVCLLEDERKCKNDYDCPEPLLCGKDFSCRPQCVTDADCVFGQVCADEWCAVKEELVDGGLPAPADAGSDSSLGDKCLYHSDCGGSLLCISGQCRPQCKAAKDCPAGHECSDGVCIATAVPDGGTDGSTDAGPVVPSCKNGTQDGDETSVDCGGACGACAGTPCTKPSDCASLLCTGKQCVAPSCGDSLQNGDESDVDCGGSCPKCPAPKGCWTHQDCVTGSCLSGSCTAPGCSDGSKNGAETDVDCGGTQCSPCADGKLCEQNEDCASQNCVGKKCVKAGPTSWVIVPTPYGVEAALTSDAQGNPFVALQWSNVIDVGSGPVSPVGGYEVLLAKFTPAGALSWSRNVGGANHEFPRGLSLDGQGNLLAGFESVQGGGFGGAQLACASGYYPMVFAKYKAGDGSHAWSRCISGPGTNALWDTAVDANGDLIAAGSFSGSVDFGGVVLSEVWPTAFVAKFSGVTGNLVWVKKFASTAGAEAFSVATQGSQIFVTGRYWGDMTVGANVLSAVNTQYDTFAFALDSSGAPSWAKSFGGAGWDEPTDSTARGGFFYVTGVFSGQVDMGGTLLNAKGGDDVFLLRLKQADGSVDLALGFGSTETDRAYGVAVSSNGEMAIGGAMGGAINFGGGPLPYVGSNDGFFARFGTSGTHLASKGFGTLWEDQVRAVGYAGTALMVVGNYGSGGVVDLGTGVLPTTGGGFFAHLVP